MEALSRDFAPRGFRVAAVSVDDAASADRVRAFARQDGLTFDVLRDPAGGIRDRYETRAVPERFLIGADGILRKKV